MVDRPHPGWWVAVLGGLGATAVLAFDRGVYDLWSRHVTGVFSRTVLGAILVAALLTHLVEALSAQRVARRAGLETAARGWFWQTLALGFPSLRLLLRRAPRR